MLLVDLTQDEIKELIVKNNFPAFRGKQIYDWILKGAYEYDLMNNVPKDLRHFLSENYKIGLPTIYNKFVSKIDGTRKYALKLHDGHIIECVLMKYKHGYSICVSSQVGCKMGCLFCASTGIKFIRNLSFGEILGEIIVVQKDLGERISNVVMMGIGEPLDNFENLTKFIDRVNSPDGLNIGQRHIAISTCGLVPKMLKLSEREYQITLSVSLHAPNDLVRSDIMPVNNRYNVATLLDACKRYINKTHRRITFEYAMINGVNDSKEQAIELAGLLKGMLCHVNLIPMNDIPNSPMKKSDINAINDFKNILIKKGIETTIRREMGADIAAACGQLRRDLTE